MVIERITGGKPPEVRKSERGGEEKPVRAPGRAEPSAGAESSATAEVSERSRAAIKAYRIAAEAKPDLSRAARVAEIKAQIASGSYQPAADKVADAIIKSVIRGG